MSQSTDQSARATALLQNGRRGEEKALDELLPLVYDELREIAHRLLCKRPAGGVLQTTALVHEAYLKLIDQSAVEWEDQVHFQALAAQAMRHILIDHFRKQSAEKRGGDAPKVSLKEGTIPVRHQLAERDERQAQVVMCRFFGGMSQRAIADVLDVSTRTVRRDWKKARAWLGAALSDE